MKTNRPIKRRVSSLLESVLILAVVFTLSLSSCKKDSGTSEATPVNNTLSKSDLLSSKAWTLSACTVTPAMMGTTDMYAQMQPCEKDNTLKLNADKSYIEDEGVTKCNSMNPQKTAGTWKLSGDESTLTLNLGSNTTDYKLLNVSSTSLKVSTTVGYSGETYTITETFSNN